MNAPRRFQLVRHQDPSGISGTGVVAYGVEFGDGVVAIRWNPKPGGVAQTAVWNCIADVEAVHGHGGATVIEWID